MRTRFDQFGKQMLSKVFCLRGAAETEAEVSPDTQRIDVWFVPDPARAADHPPLDLLDRLTQRPCQIELFHCPPNESELIACLHKSLGFRRILAQRPEPMAAPMMWAICAGRPTKAMKGLYLHPARDFPRGVYRGPPLLRLGLVVVSELRVTRQTLLLRLLGRGKVLKRAINELKALPDDARERSIALPLLLRLRLEIPADASQRTADDEEFWMSTQDVVEVWERQVLERGVQKGRVEGRAEGLVAVYEARFGTMPPDLRAVIDATRDEATLRSWYPLLATRSADEIAATLRTSGASGRMSPQKRGGVRKRQVR
jgi:hypothetical protein